MLHLYLNGSQMKVNPENCNLLINESCKKGISGNITVNVKNYQEQRLVINLALNWMWYIYARKLVIRFMC